MALHVDSEVGRLRQVIVHRPGLELSRLTPQNAGGLLFDSVLWAQRAQEEHDAFTEALRARGVQVHLYDRLLADVLDADPGRSFVLERTCTERAVGPSLADPLRSMLEDLDGAALARLLVGGVRRGDLGDAGWPSAPGLGGLRLATLGPDDFLLAPLPNHLFPRDGSWVVNRAVSISPMATAVRRREALHTRAILRYHPLFATSGLTYCYGDDDDGQLRASVEGGDVHVVGDGVVLIGVGERTTPTGAESLAVRLLGHGEVRAILAVALPSPAFIHLDMVLSMVDRHTFVVRAGLDPALRSWTLSPDGQGGLLAEENADLWQRLGSLLGSPQVVLTSGHDPPHEQFLDGANYLALAPGVVVGYDRNVGTNAVLEDHGVEVVTVPSGELSRGRGGPRCMTCPIERDGAR